VGLGFLARFTQGIEWLAFAVIIAKIAARFIGCRIHDPNHVRVSICAGPLKDNSLSIIRRSTDPTLRNTEDPAVRRADEERAARFLRIRRCLGWRLGGWIGRWRGSSPRVANGFSSIVGSLGKFARIVKILEPL
jgi:hypothetical protein